MLRDRSAVAMLGKETVDPQGTLLITDEYAAYNAAKKIYQSATINHKVAYADGDTHTIEGFWSLIKWAWYGSHHHYSRKWMPLFIAESCWKYNQRRNPRIRDVHAGVLRMNRLYYGDCLTIMQEMPLGSVDLIYLDPPFNSQRDCNAIYKTETGKPLPDQLDAFCDTWTLDEETERAVWHMPVLMRESGIEDDVAEFWRRGLFL